MEKEIRIDREKLYEQVWSQPITALAKQYYISDVGLIKICKKLQIPLPGRGYWQKKARRKRPPLPPLKGAEPFVIHKIKPHETLEMSPEENEEIQAMLNFEKLPENRIQVASQLRSPHPLVDLTNEFLSQSQNDNFGRLWIPRKKCLNVSVSRQSINRAMRIFDALIKGFEKRKMKISVRDDQETEVVVLGEPVKMRLEEKMRQRERQLTSEEKIKFLQYGWISNRYEYIPTGKLSLKIDGWGDGLRKLWSDGKTRRLEDCLNDFVIGIIKMAAYKREWHRAREREEMERQEKERQRLEKIERIKAEKERVLALEKKASDWHKSKQIREYIEAVKQDALLRDGEIIPGSELDEWINWARRQADRLDPITESPPSILDYEEEGKNEYSMRYGFPEDAQ